MCEAKNFFELKIEVTELQEDLNQIMNNWQHHFAWLAALNINSNSNEKNLSKYTKIQDAPKILVNILRNWKRSLKVQLELTLQSLKYYSRIFLKWYSQKRESLILKKVDKLEFKFNKKLEKNHGKLVIFRERRFREMIRLGEVI